MFENCLKLDLEGIGINKFDTSKITDMSSMFSNCKNITSLNISNFNTKKVLLMSPMFSGCSNLTSLDLSNFNTPLV